jgi:hypothetical protein
MTHAKTSFNQLNDFRIPSILKRIEAVDEGKIIIDFIRDNQVQINLRSEGIPFAQSNIAINEVNGKNYIYGPLVIDLNETLDDNNLLQAIIHETQHLRHHLNGFGNPPFLPNLDDHCLIRRVQEADAQAVTTDIAYKLMLQGDDGPFNALLNTEYAEMCKAYQGAVSLSNQNLQNGIAKRYAFDKWFQHKYMCQYYDRDTVNIQTPLLNAILLNNKNSSIIAAALDHKWLEGLGGINSINYLQLDGFMPLSSEKYKKDIVSNLNNLNNGIASNEP